MEQELISNILKGDQNAAKHLYEMYFGYVLTLCKRYHVKEVDMKDFLQEVFSTLFESIHRYNTQKGEFKYWMRRVCINTIISLLRKNRYEWMELEHDKPSDEADPTQQIYYKELLDLVRAMPQKYLLPFNMFIIDGYTSKEISVALNLNENTVRTLISRGRDWMKKHNSQLI